ncbi:PIG-L deacetylase family protein [Cellulomonas carbonis]|uniref:GlcNAc-PI de-N-acetylase n=1 Tax=Cellulomonas carbonis T26 TaxID=947969 RepID=A0A0A0BYP2_9CELL|nr:PIG-L family deacetylase [Cellulomonas carbonis]KGM12244.1 hypothetical protein N868_00755 [Cellulomonas carbonis T26]GGB96237.1 hypothetical protein GCM10010972_06200 [Cellulomonas carbonis]
MVLSPHPDDETLRLAAYVLHCRQRGDRLTLLCASDGGASKAARKLGWSPEFEQEYRRAEQAGAWSALTGGQGRIVRLGLPDGGVTPEPVRDAIVQLGVSAVVVAAHPTDEHRDHLACVEGAAAARVSVVYALEPTGRVGRLYLPPPELRAAAELAHRWYSGFGHRSVKTLFRAHQANRYASRVVVP